MNPVVIIGGSGFVGRQLTAALRAEGQSVRIVGRNRETIRQCFGDGVDAAEWDGCSPEGLVSGLEHSLAVVNLAGENVGQPPWTRGKKARIRDSRLQETRAVAAALRQAANPPSTLIQASAIGYYGDRADEELSETSRPGSGFLADVCQGWEQAGANLPANVRRVTLRIGIVLGREGGMLSSVLPLFRLYGGGHPGNGRQWMSWIHLADLVAAVQLLLRRNDLSGPFNLVAPQAQRARDFYRILGRVLRRPSWLHPPAFILRVLLQDMARDLLLASARVRPDALLQAGFEWSFADLEDALSDLLDV